MPTRTWIVAFLTFLFLGVNTSRAGTLSVTLVDEHGSPTPARVYLFDPAGVALTAPETIVYDKTRNGITERHFVPPTGAFKIDLPAGRYHLVVEKGKEYEPIDQQIDIPAIGVVERSLKCARWIDMKARGWYSADMHAHRPLKDLATLMESEDLNFTIPLTRWRYTGAVNEDPDLQAFLARSDESGIIKVGTNRFVSVLNEELEPGGVAVLVSHLVRTQTTMPLPLLAYSRLAHTRGGVVDVEKVTTAELPLLAALDACDVTGLCNNHLWRTGGIISPWGVWPKRAPGDYPITSAGYAQAGFDIYAYLLDMGFRIAPSAGSANGVHPVPLGWSRIYVHTTGEFTPQAWYEALRKGRSFVTTGPMLLLNVSGHEPGDEVRDGTFPMKVQASIEVLSNEYRSIDSVEIVVNGQPREVRLTPDPAHPHTCMGRVALTLETSTWIAARWVAGRPDSCDAAHTGAVYFWKNDEPIPASRHEVVYFLGRVDRMIEEMEAQLKTTTTQPAKARPENKPEVLEESLKLMREAREVYRKKLMEVK